MKNISKQRWFIILFCILVFLALAAVLIFVVFRPTEWNTIAETPSPPSETALTAEMSSGNEMSDQELYDAYSHENDPAYPVLDVKVTLQISNLGSQPGAPRPQDLALEYPQMSSQPTATPTPAPPATPASSPSVTLNPNMPGINPGVSFPVIALPDLYIINPEIESPMFTEGSYTLAWKYTAGRTVTFTVLLSTDQGESFNALKKGISGEEYTLSFPDTPSNHCILRVAAMLDGIEYKIADTSEFALVAAPVLAPPPIENYVDPQVQYIDMPGLRISSESGLPVWFNAENHAENATKLIWQLSRVPFVGTQASFGQETGILASGEVPKTGGEFSVDLKTLCEELAKPDAERGAGMPFLPRQSIYELYLRVVEVFLKRIERRKTGSLNV